MKSNDTGRRKTEEELLQSFLTLLEPDQPPPRPKSEVVKAKEHWAEKPIEVVIREEAAHNEALIERLRAEQEIKDAEFRHARYQGLIDSVWQNQLDYQASLMELGRPSFHRGPGDPDW